MKMHGWMSIWMKTDIHEWINGSQGWQEYVFCQNDVISCAQQVELLENQLATRMEQLQATVQSKTAVPTAQVYVSLSQGKPLRRQNGSDCQNHFPLTKICLKGKHHGPCWWEWNKKQKTTRHSIFCSISGPVCLTLKSPLPVFFCSFTGKK